MFMIQLTKINGHQIVLNPDLIEDKLKSFLNQGDKKSMANEAPDRQTRVA
jgi:hypothetical protein